MVGGLPLKPGVIAVNCWVNQFESEDFGGYFSCGHLGLPNILTSIWSNETTSHDRFPPKKVAKWDPLFQGKSAVDL